MIEIVSRQELITDQYHSLLYEARELLVYAELSYLDAIANFTKSDLYFVAEYDSETMIGALPFCILNGELGPVLNSLPFYGSNGGIVARNGVQVSEQEIINKLIEFGLEKKCLSITVIESPISMVSHELYSEFQYRDTRISMVNRFERGMTANQLLETFEDPRPRNIRKAMKSGISIERSNSSESIDFLAETHFENIKEVGGLPKPKHFFEEFLGSMPADRWTIFEAFFGNQRIASLLILIGRDSIEYFTPATIKEFRSLQGQALLIFHAMLFCIEKEIPNWNWGGTWETQKGVYDFKKKWSPMESTYSYFCKILDPRILVCSKEEILLKYPNFYVLPFDELQV